MPGARVERGERVTLRTLEREDTSFRQRGCTDPELRYTLGTPVRNRAQLEERFADDAADRFVVCLDAPDALAAAPDEGDVERIGVVSVEDADWKRPELGYWLVPSVHGEGYGSEAVSLALDYTFRTYDTPAVGASAFASNDASRGLLESIEFAEEGRRRKFMYVDGAHRDMVQYGLLREEWEG